MAKKSRNPYGKGKPIPHEIFIESIKPFEAKLDLEAQKSHEMYRLSIAEKEKVLNNFVDKLKQAGIDFESITGDSMKTIKQLAEQAREER